MSEYNRLKKWTPRQRVFEIDDFDHDLLSRRPCVFGVSMTESAQRANLAIIKLLVQIKEERRRYS